MSEHNWMRTAARVTTPLAAVIFIPLSVAIFLVGIIDVVQWFWGLVT